jgi:HrpA-like RNA helicase
VGLPLAALPLEPALGRCLLKAGELGCAEEVATMVAMLSVGGIW